MMSHKQRLSSKFLLATLLLLPACNSTNPDHSVVICGHLHSLFTPSKTSEIQRAIGWTQPLESFVIGLQDLQPEAMFLLGDTTRFASAEEWELVQQNLALVPGAKHYLAGNHEHRVAGNPQDLDTKPFLQRGGKINAAVIIHRNKYLLLDAKTYMEPEDLAFLRRELADHKNYDNVFVLMHYYILPTLPAPSPGEAPGEGIDPLDPYAKTSNWNSEVVPLLAGRVRYVFCGDYYEQACHRAVQKVGDEEIHYIINSFGFGRGKGDKETGDGPQIYLQLRFDQKGLSIIPRALPLDVRHPWYRAFGNIDPK